MNLQTIRRNPGCLIELDWTRDQNAALGLPDNNSLYCDDVYTAEFEHMTFCLAGDLYFELLNQQQTGGAVGIQAAEVEARLVVRNSQSNSVMLDLNNLKTADFLAKLMLVKGDI